jgi:hypothetical protein
MCNLFNTGFLSLLALLDKKNRKSKKGIEIDQAVNVYFISLGFTLDIDILQLSKLF